VRRTCVLNSAICGLESVICQGIPLASWRPDNRPFCSHLKTVCVEIDRAAAAPSTEYVRQPLWGIMFCSVDFHGWQVPAFAQQMNLIAAERSSVRRQKAFRIEHCGDFVVHLLHGDEVANP
jgi:hypothetical protein